MPRPQPDNIPSVYPGDVFPRRSDGRLYRLCLVLKSWFLWSCLILCCLLIVVVIILFIILLLLVGLEPDSPTVTMENAYHTRFNLTAVALASSNNYTLDYNLTVELSLRNGNRGFSFCHWGLESAAYYHSQWLTLAKIPDFCQESKSSGKATLAFLGRSSVELLPAQMGFFQNEERAGLFLVNVSVKGKTNSIVNRLNWKYHSNLDLMCWLKVPMLAGKTSPAGGGAFPMVDCVQPPRRSD